MKIHSLSIENTKRVRAVALQPEKSGLTVIGGNNGQGKTSVLDAIAWALGGDRRKPTNAQRDESVLPPMIKITFDSGIVVERKGKNSALTVTDTAGRKAGQRLLDEFISELAIDLPKFMQATGREKARILLDILGVGDELHRLEEAEKQAYDERRIIGREVDRKAAFIQSLPYFPDAPKDLINPASLIHEVQEIMIHNAENERLRRERQRLTDERYRLGRELEALEEKYRQAVAAQVAAERAAENLIDQPTDELERAIAEAEETNRKVRANLDRDKAEEDGRESSHRYSVLTAQIDEIRRQKTALLSNADLPLADLSIEDGNLVYKGKSWDCMSSSEQMRVATAIASRMKPHCGFVLLDKLEQMDVQTMREFGEWLEEQGLQAIATRVSTGEECTIIIEDGVIAEPEKTWKKGGFANANHQR